MINFNFQDNFVWNELIYSFWLCRYHLHDVVVGKIYFLLVRLKIVRMKVQLLRKEIISSGTKISVLCCVVLIST